MSGGSMPKKANEDMGTYVVSVLKLVHDRAIKPAIQQQTMLNVASCTCYRTLSSNSGYTGT